MGLRTVTISQGNDKVAISQVEPGHVKLYVCGVTTYDLCHIGHARVYVFFDVLCRYLRQLGYRVTYVRNITDIDDKIIKRAVESGKSVDEITQVNIQNMWDDFAALGIGRPDHEPRATEYIAEMIEMIQTLVDKGHAYQADSGDVCYAVEKFEGYGKLSGRTLDALKAGARVESDDSRQSAHDFVLWKPSKPGEPSWSSPWGEGRPGWHIECSAMSKALLGMPFDVHGGGVDLKFPHHENEIAQSEAACGCRFVNQWMHLGHVTVGSEKMSKSLGNFLTIRDALKQYHPEQLRWMLLMSHYRHPVDYDPALATQAHTILRRCYEALKPAGQSDVNDELMSWLADYEAKFHAALCDDLNIPLAFQILYEVVREANKQWPDNDAWRESIIQWAKPLGVLQCQPDNYLNWQSSDKADVEVAEIEALVEQRQQARANKDWAQSDAIRDQLADMGVVCEDGEGESSWRWKS